MNHSYNDIYEPGLMLAFLSTPDASPHFLPSPRLSHKLNILYSLFRYAWRPRSLSLQTAEPGFILAEYKLTSTPNATKFLYGQWLLIYEREREKKEQAIASASLLSKYLQQLGLTQAKL